MYPYGLIGNCQSSAHIHLSGSIDWLCFPRPDSPPVFGKLLDEAGGHFSIETKNKSRSSQRYLENTNILETTVTTEAGDQFTITDFFPRFVQHGRSYRPMSLFRIVRPIKGHPEIKVVCRPVDGWAKNRIVPERGNSHLRFQIRDTEMRLTSNMPMTYLSEESFFALNDRIDLALTWSGGLEDDLLEVTNRFLQKTTDYWHSWVKHCSIPYLYQKETIRSALALKLHCYEDTGAILAALTTSLPEEVGHERNWDYRLCWLRDSYFSLSAFHALGHFEEMEGFVKFLVSIAEASDKNEKRLRPVYRLDQTLPLPEKIHDEWAGFMKSAPVRSDNQAAEHIQNDVYGEMVLTMAPIFFDERFQHLRTKDHEILFESMVTYCLEKISEPDAGLWEIRDGWREHTFSNLMCWAGLDRALTLRRNGYLKSFTLDLEAGRQKAEIAVMKAVQKGSIRNGPADASFDASLLLAAALRFPGSELLKKTVSDIRTKLGFGPDQPDSSFLFRYLREDDFGKPQSAFMICSFWLVQALAKVGEQKEAQAVMDEIMKSSNHLGLFAEHFDPKLKFQSGNFPQAYSHVGQINAAFALSPSWNDIL